MLLRLADLPLHAAPPPGANLHPHARAALSISAHGGTVTRPPRTDDKVYVFTDASADGPRASIAFIAIALHDYLPPD
eukprot:8621201-Lingulodinium_polyedra.AAC.1